jgi:hypothetical protein
LAYGGHGAERFSRRKAGAVFQQVVAHLRVGVELAMDEVHAGGLTQPGAGGGDQASEIELVGIDQQPDHGLFVVRLVRDVGEDEEARFGIGQPACPANRLGLQVDGGWMLGGGRGMAGPQRGKRQKQQEVARGESGLRPLTGPTAENRGTQCGEG